MSETPESILDGVDSLINTHFFTGERFTKYRYEHKRSCNVLSAAQPEAFDGTKLIADVYDRIETNLSLRPDRSPSPENWKIRSEITAKNIQPSTENKSAEVTLERAIAQRWPEKWTYQMPVASGLFGSKSDKRRAIDLVCLGENGCFDFIELKIESNTPLYAAMEILGYGLVYLASRKDSAKNLKYGNGASLPVMNATAISLVVLAPSDYYEKYKLDWLERGINGGLAALLKDMRVTNLQMNFCFKKFEDDFKSSQKFTPEMLPEELVFDRVYP